MSYTAPELIKLIFAV